MVRVGFSHANGFWSFLSRIIMAATGRPYSHVWLLLDGPDGFRGRAVVMEDSLEGFRVVPYDGYGVGKTIVKVVVPPYPLDKGVDQAVNWLGGRYDTPGLVGMAWVIAFRKWFKKKVRNPFRNSHAMWCSEAVASVIQASGNYPNAADIDPSRMGPEDVDDLLALKAVD